MAEPTRWWTVEEEYSQDTESFAPTLRSEDVTRHTEHFIFVSRAHGTHAIKRSREGWFQSKKDALLYYIAEKSKSMNEAHEKYVRIQRQVYAVNNLFDQMRLKGELD